jgi:hypothetical protein
MADKPLDEAVRSLGDKLGSLEPALTDDERRLLVWVFEVAGAAAARADTRPLREQIGAAFERGRLRGTRGANEPQHIGPLPEPPPR